MGLVISSLAEINPELSRSCWLYLLDYGLKTEISEAIKSNFVHFSERSSEAGSVFVLGTTRHVQNELLSWHNVFGLAGGTHLPALLVCTANPRLLMTDHVDRSLVTENHKAVLIPLTGEGLTVDIALNTVEKTFDLIKAGELDSIFVAKTDNVAAPSNPIIDLKPNFFGIGINLNEVWKRTTNRHEK